MADRFDLHDCILVGKSKSIARQLANGRRCSSCSTTRTFNQTSAYGGVRWGERNHQPARVEANGDVMGMAQVRIVRPTPLKFGMALSALGPDLEAVLPTPRSRGPHPDGRCHRGRIPRQEEASSSGFFPTHSPDRSAPQRCKPRSARFIAEPLDSGNTYRTLVLGPHSFPR